MHKLRVLLLQRLENFVDAAEHARRRYEGDDFTRQLCDGMARQLASHFPSITIDNEDRASYRGVTLLYLGQIPYDKMNVGQMVCQRAAYLGEDGKIYIEGPRRFAGKTVIDIRPYNVKHAQGSDGISRVAIADMLAAYFI